MEMSSPLSEIPVSVGCVVVSAAQHVVSSCRESVEERVGRDMDEEKGVVGGRGATHVCGDLNKFVGRHVYIHSLGDFVDGMSPDDDSKPHYSSSSRRAHVCWWALWLS